MTHEEKFKEMLAMQDELNQKLHPNWKQMPWSMDQAIIAETGELLDALGFKWWKDSGEIDYDNVRLELIDLWHFLLNKILIHKQEQHLEVELKDIIERSYLVGDLTDKQVCVKLREWLVDELGGQFNFELFLGICLTYGLNFEELHWLYMMKNVLNMFRWNNGYADGSYKKDWNGREDNAVLMEMSKQNSEASFKQLYAQLELYYNQNVKDRIILPN